MPPSPNREAALQAFGRLARAYVLELGQDDQFVLRSRVQVGQEREALWTPSDGLGTLSAMLDDYAEYFEGIQFPRLDPACVPAHAAADEVYLHGVGLDVINVMGTAWTAQRLEGLDEKGIPSHHAEEPRERRLALYHCTWPPRQAAAVSEALQQGLTDASGEVRATAALLAGRCRALALVESVRVLLTDAQGTVREAAVRGLKMIDEMAAIAACAPLLSDSDAAVRLAAFSVLRHVQHLPWIRRQEIMSDVASDVEPALGYLDGESGTLLLEWMAGSGGEAALRVVEALGMRKDEVACKAVAVAITLQQVDVLPSLVRLLEHGTDPVRTEVVCALQGEAYRRSLQERPILMTQVMRILQEIAESGN